MYLIEYESGNFEMAPPDFKPEELYPPDLEKIRRVYCVSRILEKQVKLVAKPKEEIRKIRETRQSAPKTAKNRAGENGSKR